MDRITECDGIIFSEGKIDGAVVSSVNVELSKQNARLGELKTKMANQAKGLGANSISNYSYRQEKRLFGWDNLSLVGTGMAVIAPEDVLSELKKGQIG